MTLLVVSDLHCGRLGLGENAVSREKKAVAVGAIADFVRAQREGLSLVLLGDIFHRPDGYSPNKGEGFDAPEAARQIGPLAEELRANDVPVSYVPGNCDPWVAGTEQERAAMVRLLGQEDGRVDFPGFTMATHGSLLTHGHVFNPGLVDSLRAWAGFPSGRVGTELREAMEGGDAFREKALAVDAQGGSHHLSFRLKTLVLDGLFALPVLNVVRSRLTRSLRAGWNAAYRHAYAAQADALDPRAPATIVMGHTHMPGVHDVAGGRRLVNTGSAGADNTDDGNGTVATIGNYGTPTLRWSYHRDLQCNRLEPV